MVNTPKSGMRRLLRRSLATLALAGLLGQQLPGRAVSAFDPLTVAAGGVATSVVLDKLEAKAVNVLGQAAGIASLLGSKVARDVQLAISAARQEMHEELTVQWNHLDAQKVSLLRQLDVTLKDLDEKMKAVGTLEDQIALDVNDVIAKTFPWVPESPILRRVDGASQYYRPRGMYRLRLNGNIFAPFGRPVNIRIGGKPAAPGWLNSQPPYQMTLTIPSDALNSHFKDDVLSHVPVVVEAEVPNRPWFFMVWRDRSRLARFTFNLELFPRNPLTFRAVEYAEVAVVDRGNPQIIPGPVSVIPGCGNSGCNAYHNVCTSNVPAGGEPVDIATYHDSFGGWGGFGNLRPTPTGFCATYWQHSHNVTRNVSLDMRYYPPKKDTAQRAPGLPPWRRTLKKERLA